MTPIGQSPTIQLVGGKIDAEKLNSFGQQVAPHKMDITSTNIQAEKDWSVCDHVAFICAPRASILASPFQSSANCCRMADPACTNKDCILGNTACSATLTAEESETTILNRAVYSVRSMATRPQINYEDPRRLLQFSSVQTKLLPEQVSFLARSICHVFSVPDINMATALEQIFVGLDSIEYFRQNVALYSLATQFLFFLKTKKASLFTCPDFLTSIYLVCCVLVHKYFVDHPWNNYSVAKIFGLQAKKLYDFEIFFLCQIDFCLPFRLDSMHK